MENNKKGIWITIEIIKNHELDWTNKVLLSEIISLSKLEKGCIASNQTLSNFLEIKRQTIHRRIKFLVEKGYITTLNKYSGEKCVGRIITPTGKLLADTMEAQADTMTALADTMEAHADTNDSTRLHTMTAQSDPSNSLTKSVKKPLSKPVSKPSSNTEKIFVFGVEVDLEQAEKDLDYNKEITNIKNTIKNDDEI
jgi:DNA-binding MarR family transcriptional regulator